MILCIPAFSFTLFLPSCPTVIGTMPSLLFCFCFLEMASASKVTSCFIRLQYFWDTSNCNKLLFDVWIKYSWTELCRHRHWLKNNYLYLELILQLHKSSIIQTHHSSGISHSEAGLLSLSRDEVAVFLYLVQQLPHRLRVIGHFAFLQESFQLPGHGEGTLKGKETNRRNYPVC